MFKNQPKWAAPFILSLLANALIGFMPILSQRSGTQFMPSPAFVATMHWPAICGAVLMALITIIGTFLLMPAGTRGSAWMSPMRMVPGFLAALFFAGLPFYLLLTVSVPMLGSYAGGPVAIDYGVKNDQPRVRGQRNRCKSALGLSAMPFLYDRACGIPEAVKAAVDRGDRIRLIGRGNAMGVQYESAQIIAR